MTATQKTIFNEINITPLTDIFLVLLIIMMVVAPMLEYPGLTLAVPSIGPDTNTKEEPKTVQIVIDASNQFLINNQPVAANQLVRTIREQAKERPDGLFIQAHPDASHRAMTQVMDAGQQAGVTKQAVIEYAQAN